MADLPALGLGKFLLGQGEWPKEYSLIGDSLYMSAPKVPIVARVRLDNCGHMDHYSGIKVTIMSRSHGVIDSMLFMFEEFLEARNRRARAANRRLLGRAAEQS